MVQRNILSLAIPIAFLVFSQCQAKSDVDRVLLLISYHPEFPTFFDQIDGVKAGLVESGIARKNVVVDVEFMDTKRFSPSEVVSRFRDTLEHKLASLPPYNVVITADDNATRFAVENQASLLDSRPIVFLGVNDVEFALSQNTNPLVTGVVEAVSIDDTLNLISRIRPEAGKSPIIISDTTPSGRGDLHSLLMQHPDSENHVLSLETLTHQQLRTSLAKLSASDNVLLLSAYRDYQGVSIDFEEHLSAMVRILKAPIFHLWRHGIGEGMLGGSVISHHEQGRTAGRLAASILKGERVSDMRIIEKSPNVTLVDYSLLGAFNIDPSNLPSNIELINPPTSLYQLYKSEISITAAFFFLLLLTSGLLSFYVLRLRAMRARLEGKGYALQDSEARLSLHIQNTPLGCISWDREFCCTEWNRSAEEIFGFSADEAIGLHASEIIVPAEIKRDVDRVFDLLLQQKGGSQSTNRNIRKDGKTIICDWYNTPIVSGEGNVSGVVSLVNDVTDRRRSEGLLRESEAKYRALAENSNDYIMRYDRLHRHTYANAAALRVSGKSESEYIGKTHREMGFPEHLCKLWEHAIDDVFATQEPRHEIFEWTGTEGLLYLDLRFFPVLSDDGVVDSVLGVSRDITESKRSEEALRKYGQIVSSSDDMLALLNREYLYEAANESYLERLGITSEKLIGHTASDVFGEDMFNDVIKPNAERCLAGETINYRAWFDFPRFGRRLMDTVYSPYADAGNTIQGFVVSGRDVTEKHKLEEDLLKAKKLESVAVLAGGIAHDFNNLLTGLFGNIELAERNLPDGHPAIAYVHTAHKALERTTHLTQQLLTFAKGGEPILGSVDIRQTIRESVKFTLSGSNVKTALSLPDDLWQIEADRGQISQVITNLVLNADQAMPDGGTLFVEANNIADIDSRVASNLSGHFVKLSIRDEGCGIKETYLDKVFDPYFSTQEAGQGLGLASVHSIVKRHGGHIEVESKPGAGTTFTVYLHADLSSEQRADVDAVSVPATPSSVFAHILVMDDEETLRVLLSDMLELIGCTVDTATDGRDALDKYVSAKSRGRPFDVVILDLTVPGGMGGRDAVEQLLEIDPGVKVIVSSGYSTDPIVAKYTEYGFRGRLVKPFQMDDLVGELSRIIESECVKSQ